jgi:entericidin B
MLRKSTLGRILLAAGLGALALTASACNTVKGVGQDIESVGDAGDDAI